MRVADVLIVGAGPAGIAAAVRAAECGKQVTLVDDNPVEGGQIWRGRTAGEGWFDKLDRSGAKVVTGARVIAGDATRRTLLVETAGAAFEVQYGALVLATGARELFLPFPGWTLPNVMGVGGIQAMAKGGLPVKGKRIVVGGSGPLLLAVAAYLRKQGASVPLIAEQSSWPRVLGFGVSLLGRPGKLRQAAAFGLSGYRPGCWVESAEGDGRVSSVRVRGGGKTWHVACDYLAVGYGLCPNTELAQHLGAAGKVDAFQQTSRDNVYCAGEACGVGGVDLALVEGEIAGYSAAGRRELASRLFPARAQARRFADGLNRAFAPRDELRALANEETIVCRCEDVRLGQVKAAADWRSAKLHWRCGMGPCQGRTCGPAVQFLLGWKPESVRPPVFPARVSSLITNREAETQ